MCTDKKKGLNCYYYIAILVTIKLCTKNELRPVKNVIYKMT